ncbi:MAG TPA: hypothetical protein VGM81_05780 [Burkholderiaceae bacterium]|jgi:hypothetical protein
MNQLFRYACRRQRGVIMVVALIVLVVLMIGSIAMVRSMNSALVAAGNYGFKRDMANQGVRALATVQTLMKTGALATDVVRQTSNPALNYSATQLATTPEGIPTALLSDAAFAAVASGADIAQADMGITVRYVVDRLCTTTGPVNADACVLGTAPPAAGGSGTTVRGDGRPEDAVVIPQAVYRITVRVTGPRNSQSFFQATLTA